jgi:hypothetical protein
MPFTEGSLGWVPGLLELHSSWIGAASASGRKNEAQYLGAEFSEMARERPWVGNGTPEPFVADEAVCHHDTSGTPASSRLAALEHVRLHFVLTELHRTRLARSTRRPSGPGTGPSGRRRTAAGRRRAGGDDRGACTRRRSYPPRGRPRPRDRARSGGWTRRPLRTPAATRTARGLAPRPRARRRRGRDGCASIEGAEASRRNWRGRIRERTRRRRPEQRRRERRREGRERRREQRRPVRPASAACSRSRAASGTAR